jgi:hypothetical protein
MLLAGCTFDPSGVEPVVPDAGGVDEVDASHDAAIDAATPDAERPDAELPDAEVPDAEPPDAEVPCPTNYTRGTGVNASSCYRFDSSPPRNFGAAETDCENDTTGGSHLVVISNEDEYQGILAAIQDTRLWIGAHDRAPQTEGMFVNVTGGAFDSPHFLAGEPNDFGDGPAGTAEDCLALYNQPAAALVGYNDESCNVTRAYLCEFDGVPPSP